MTDLASSRRIRPHRGSDFKPGNEVIFLIYSLPDLKSDSLCSLVRRKEANSVIVATLP